MPVGLDLVEMFVMQCVVASINFQPVSETEKNRFSFWVYLLTLTGEIAALSKNLSSATSNVKNITKYFSSNCY
ncbi:hypothetical protein RRG08_017330 [Elysia crispata]|uniref:Uncharacterized protein n=1 Tax=Elysia crispata TaxID=231223 RepID=A0AAE1B6K9_9GAST|nr:hypothetical protein RRG08_017330 [Elysia crispata]